MVDFIAQKAHIPAIIVDHSDDTVRVRQWMIYLVLTLATATLFLMALGSATRVMEAGLACPDWPLCFGQFVPEKQMNLQVFLEWFHRLIATGIGLAMIAAVSLSWWQRHHLPSWFPRSISLALLLVILQGILGGLTVTQMLRFDIVTAHLGTGTVAPTRGARRFRFDGERGRCWRRRSCAERSVIGTRDLSAVACSTVK